MSTVRIDSGAYTDEMFRARWERTKRLDIKNECPICMSREMDITWTEHEMEIRCGECGFSTGDREDPLAAIVLWNFPLRELVIQEIDELDGRGKVKGEE